MPWSRFREAINHVKGRPGALNPQSTLRRLRFDAEFVARRATMLKIVTERVRKSGKTPTRRWP
jgi:hypothetical protein